MAVQYGHPKAAALLLENGATLSREERGYPDKSVRYPDELGLKILDTLGKQEKLKIRSSDQIINGHNQTGITYLALINTEVGYDNHEISLSMPGSIGESESADAILFAQQIKKSLEKDISNAIDVCRYYSYRYALFFPNTRQPHLLSLKNQAEEFILFGAYELFGATKCLPPELKMLIFSFLLGYEEVPKEIAVYRSMEALFLKSEMKYEKNMAHHNKMFGLHNHLTIWHRKLNAPTSSPSFDQRPST
jgi:hypothetical protein